MIRKDKSLLSLVINNLEYLVDNSDCMSNHNLKSAEELSKLEKFYLESLSFIVTCPIAILHKDGTLKQSQGGWKSNVLALEKDVKLCEAIVNRHKKDPIFFFNDLFNVYFAICSWFNNDLLVIGPFADGSAASGVVRAFSIKHSTDIKPLCSYSMPMMAAVLVQAYFFVTNKVFNMFALIEENVEKKNLKQDVSNQIMNVIMRHMEAITPHNDGSWEIIRRKSIMQGNLLTLNEHIRAPFAGMRGVIAKDALRNAKNLAIVDVTVSSRAALDAGLDSETVYTISDGYILKIEEVQTQSEAEQIANIAANEFTTLVKKLKSQNINFTANTHESFIRAYNYITRNYSQRLSLEEISKESGASCSFLQKIFRRELKCSIHECINQVRIKNSIELLSNKDLSISDIALLVGFSNSSHFIKEFKKELHLTPSKYRKSSLNNYMIDIKLE